MPEFAVRQSIAEIGREAWEELFPGLPEGYDYYLAVEQAGMEGFTLCYPTVSEAGRLLCAAPAFLADYRLDTTVQGRWKKLTAALTRMLPRLMVLRLACLGSPVAENCHLGFAPRYGRAGRVALLETLVQGFSAHAREQGAGLVAARDVPHCQADLWENLERAGFHRTPGQPTAILPLSFPDLPGYLAVLGRSTAKDMRRKLRAAGAVRREVRQDISDVLPQVMELYEQTLSRSGLAFERLTADYFTGVLARMPGRAFCVLYWVGVELAGFNLVLVDQGMLVDKYIGLRQHLARQHNLYYVSWLQNVASGLEQGLACYWSGQDGYGPKLRMKCQFLPNWIYFRHRNRTANALLGLVARLIRLDRFDPDLRRITKEVLHD